MASFIDQIPQFNPYIQQLPVEAMVQVGMQKQKLYDEGVQKIQTQIDNIAGMDIMKDSQKAYLQSKLNELGNNLKTVAAGDFSNYQLVNSVSGMTGQIVKDPVIKNAVASTAHIRNQQKIVDEAKASGKASVQNIEYWNKNLNDWLTDGKVDSRFAGEYTQYTDIQKKLREIAKDVPEIESVTDIPFKRDANGQVIYDRNNKPIVDEAMMERKVKGKSAQKVLENFMSSLTENDINQLKIDSWYHYRNLNPQQLRQGTIDSYQEKKKMYSDRVAEISAQLASNTKLSSTDVTRLTADMNKYQQILNSGELDKAMVKDIQSMVDDLDGYKYKLYTDRTLQGAAQAAANESVSTTIKDNPYWKAAMDMKNYNLDVQKMNQAERHFQINKQLEQQKINIERAKLAQEQDGGLANTIVENMPLDTREVEKISAAGKTSQVGQELEFQRTFLSQKGKMLVPGYESMSDKERDAAFSKIMDAYNANPNNITNPDKRRMLAEYRTSQLNIQKIVRSVGAANAAVVDYDRQIANVTKGFAPVTVYGKTYSSKEYIHMMEDAKKFSKLTTNYSGIASVPKATFDSEAFLNKYKGTESEALATLIAKNFGGAKLTGSEKDAFKFIRDVNLSLAPTVQQLISARDTKWANEMAKRDPMLQDVYGTINMENKVTKARVNGIIGNLQELYNNQGAFSNLREGESFDPTTINEWFSKGGDVKYGVRKRGDGTGALVITKGSERQVIPLNQEQLIKYLPELAMKNPAQDIVGEVLSSSMKTTNRADVRDNPVGAVNAAFTGDDLPTLLKGTGYASTTRFDIEGASDNDGSSGDGYLIRMYAFDENSGQWKTGLVTDDFISADAIYTTLQGVGTKMRDKILNSK